jgi:hypothetical protein
MFVPDKAFIKDHPLKIEQTTDPAAPVAGPHIVDHR